MGDDFWAFRVNAGSFRVSRDVVKVIEYEREGKKVNANAFKVGYASGTVFS